MDVLCILLVETLAKAGGRGVTELVRPAYRELPRALGSHMRGTNSGVGKHHSFDEFVRPLASWLPLEDTIIEAARQRGK
ncbi:MAG: hypothetical protein RPU35_04065 [Candidatus Sedimenticola sp. (ex Thyasira tokunagai)]